MLVFESLETLFLWLAQAEEWQHRMLWLLTITSSPRPPRRSRTARSCDRARGTLVP